MARATASNITAKLASLMAMVILALTLSTAPALAEDVEGSEVVGVETTQVLENETETVAETNNSVDGLDVSGATETTTTTETGTENVSSEVSETVKSDTVDEDTSEASESAVELNESENAPEATNNALGDSQALNEAAELKTAESAEKTETFDGLTVTGLEGSYRYEGSILTITGNATVSGTSTSSIVVGDENSDPSTPIELTLAGVNITAAKGAAIKIVAGVTAVFHLQGENSVTGGSGYAGVQVGWESEKKFASLTIDGDGKLVANGGSDSAGIGGSKNDKGLYGDITINGGTIEATGNRNGAGIGSSDNLNNGKSNGSFKYTDQRWGTITINGGRVTATGGSGGNGGAGIGGGNHTDSGLIVINGGTIIAEGTTGIGCGFGSSSNKSTSADKGPGYYFATVEINGGNVTATGRSYGGAGIGGSTYGDAEVVINGGTIWAYGGAGSDNLHHGGAGIGGGYVGHANITITGGEVHAYVGSSSAGAAIGSGGTPNSNEERVDRKNQTTGRSTVEGITHLTDTKVAITGGTIYADASAGHGGAGIGGGVSADRVFVSITGGTIVAIGAPSSEVAMQGGAGIGSGLYGPDALIHKEDPTKTDKDAAMYHEVTYVVVDVTGGTVTAIGGWGAAGIGSGAENNMVHHVTVDATKAEIEAYADGTKFAIDTRVVTEDGKTESANNTSVEGNILQGTFVHKGEIGDYDQNPEGLSSIQVINESTGEAKNLTGMGTYNLTGYRSFATNVDTPGNYSVYTDDESIGHGEGRFFARCYTDVWNSDEAIYDAHYVVSEGKLSDNNYLFPVKAIVITKVVRDTQGNPIPGLDGTFYFALWVNDATKPAGGYYITRADGSIWTEKVEVVAGVALNRAIFAGLNDMTYSVWEVKDENAREDMIVSATSPVAFGAWNLVNVATTDTVGTGNKGTLDEKTWSQYVTVYNTFVAVNSEPTGPTTPEDPAEPEVVTDDPVPVAPAPQTPAAPVVPAPVVPVAPVVVPAAAVIAPAAAPAVAAIVDDATPLAAALEAIDDDATPLAGFEDEGCWVHPWIILGTLITAIYSLVVLYRRRHSHNTLGDYEEQVLGEETQDVPAGAPAPVMA